MSFDNQEETHLCLSGTPTPTGPALWAEEAARGNETGEITTHMRHPRESSGGVCMPWFKTLRDTVTKKKKSQWLSQS